MAVPEYGIFMAAHSKLNLIKAALKPVQYRAHKFPNWRVKIVAQPSTYVISF